MNGRYYCRLCGLLLGAVCIGGCGNSRQPALNPAAASAKSAPAAVASQSPDAAGTSQPTEIANSQWELDPPKSTALVDTAAPRDTGAVFMHYCSVCHGAEGRGNGQYFSDDLPSRPANLTDQKVMQSLSDEHLISVITDGSAAVGKSPLCPPWGRVFSKEQVADLVVYIRKLPAQSAQSSQDNQKPQQ